MTGASLSDLPEELLEKIVDVVEGEGDLWGSPTKGLLNLRQTCKTLERACHKTFLAHFTEWTICLWREGDLSATKAVLQSIVHATAIEKITFVYQGQKPSLWHIAPFLNEIFSSLASLNREIILMIDPWRRSIVADPMSTEGVLYFVNMILTAAATARLAVSSVQVRSRRENWAVSDGELLADLHDTLNISRHHLSQGSPQELVVEYPRIGQISFNYAQGCLSMKGVRPSHWTEFSDWFESLECDKITIEECVLNPSDLDQVLSSADASNHPIRALSIVNTKIPHLDTVNDTDLDCSDLNCIDLYRLVVVILPFAHQLENVHLASIQSDREADSGTPAFVTDCDGGLQFTGKDGMTDHLLQLQQRLYV